MIEIYNRLASDQTYKLQLETSDEIECILQQIKMVLGTQPGDILAEPYFGLNLKKYIFSLSYNQTEINQIVKNAILNNISYDKSKYNVEIEVNFGKDYENAADYAVINITINQIKYLGVLISQ